MNECPINMELFSCSGGMAEGFHRAGIEFDFVFDYDEDACNSYEQNLKHRPVRMDVRDLVRMTKGGWRPGPIGLLVADPPCTPWSRAGKRLGTDDERDMLEETAELITLLRPRAYLIGNVPGLQDSTSWHVVQRVIGGLQKHGYCVADYSTLDAADYGVPQHRIRPFWFGHLDGPCVRWPAPTHGDPWHPALPGLALKPWVTCRKALQHLPLEDLGRPVRLKRNDSNAHGRTWDNHPPSHADEPSKVIKCNGGRNAGNAAAMVVPELTTNDAHPISTLDEPARGIRANRANTGAQGGAALAVTSLERMVPPDEPHRTVTAAGRGAHPSMEWPWDRPATTVCKDPRIPPPGHHDENSFMSAPEARGLKKKRPPSTKGPQWTRVSDPDAPAPTVLTDPDTRATSSAVKLPLERPSMGVRVGAIDQPADVVTSKSARVGAGAGQVKEWPWSRPSTTVCAGIDKIAPAGEHAGQYGPNAVVLSERAAAILQGFPESWVFSGATKKARWAQIGMAMPPPLAEAVARAIRAALDAAPAKVGT